MKLADYLIGIRIDKKENRNDL